MIGSGESNRKPLLHPSPTAGEATINLDNAMLFFVCILVCHFDFFCGQEHQQKRQKRNAMETNYFPPLTALQTTIHTHTEPHQRDCTQPAIRRNAVGANNKKKNEKWPTPHGSLPVFSSSGTHNYLCILIRVWLRTCVKLQSPAKFWIGSKTYS